MRLPLFYYEDYGYDIECSACCVYRLMISYYCYHKDLPRRAVTHHLEMMCYHLIVLCALCSVLCNLQIFCHSLHRLRISYQKPFWKELSRYLKGTSIEYFTSLFLCRCFVHFRRLVLPFTGLAGLSSFTLSEYFTLLTLTQRR